MTKEKICHSQKFAFLEVKPEKMKTQGSFIAAILLLSIFALFYSNTVACFAGSRDFFC